MTINSFFSCNLKEFCLFFCKNFFYFFSNAYFDPLLSFIQSPHKPHFFFFAKSLPGLKTEKPQKRRLWLIDGFSVVIEWMEKLSLYSPFIVRANKKEENCFPCDLLEANRIQDLKILVIYFKDGWKRALKWPQCKHLISITVSRWILMIFYVICFMYFIST